MTREELRRFVDEECEYIKKLFTQKNVAYGRYEDAFHNFVEAARRVLHSADLHDALKTLLIYINKHLIALENIGAEDKEAVERFRDLAVYSLIGAAMVRTIQGRHNEDNVYDAKEADHHGLYTRVMASKSSRRGNNCRAV